MKMRKLHSSFVITSLLSTILYLPSTAFSATVTLQFDTNSFGFVGCKLTSLVGTNGNPNVVTNTQSLVTFGAANTVTNTFGGKLTILGFRVQAGSNTVASGLFSHAEGQDSVASGTNSHAEGGGLMAGSIASGNASHAEGESTIASGEASHAEGGGSFAIGVVSHAEGSSSYALGDTSHAEGDGTIASGGFSHSAGQNAYALDDHTFVWSDGTMFTNSMSEQFSAYAANGFRFLGGSISGNGNDLTSIPSNAIVSINPSQIFPEIVFPIQTNGALNMLSSFDGSGLTGLNYLAMTNTGNLSQWLDAATNAAAWLNANNTFTGNVGIGTVPASVLFGQTNVLMLFRPAGGSSYPQVATFSLGRFALGGVSPKTRLDINLKDTTDGTVDGDKTVMTFQSDGNVGIGTTAPSELLSLESSGSPGIKIRTISAGTFITPLKIGLKVYGSADTLMGEVVVLDSSFDTLGKQLAINLVDEYNVMQNRIFIDYTGKVGIGTNAPDSLLNVAGNGHFNGTVTATSFSGSGAGLTSLNGGQLRGQIETTNGQLVVNGNGSLGSVLSFIPNISDPSIYMTTTNYYSVSDTMDMWIGPSHLENFSWSYNLYIIRPDGGNTTIGGPANFMGAVNAGGLLTAGNGLATYTNQIPVYMHVAGTNVFWSTVP